MSRHRKSKIVAAIIAVLALSVYLLLFRAPSPDPAPFALQLQQMREAAGRGGALPLRLNALVVGEGRFPSMAVVAGDSLLQKTAMSFVSYQLVYADGSIILETAHDRAIHEDFFSGQPFYQENFDRMQQAMRKSRMILVTHEHMDHVGGISHSPYFNEIRDRVHMTAEQISGPTTAAARWPEGALQSLTPLRYDGVYSPAPGIALLKAPGHSQGTQLIYLRLADGKEFLLIGDIAWNMQNVDRVRGRPLLVSAVMLRENRQAVVDQLSALHQLKEEMGERVQIVAAHDSVQLHSLLERGLIHEGFE